MRYVRLFTVLILSVSMVTMLVGCGKTLSQIQDSVNASADALGSAAKTVEQHVGGMAGDATSGAIDNAVGLVKKAVSIGLSVYQDVKDNLNTLKGVVVPSATK